jgi:hypothetical protein
MSAKSSLASVYRLPTDKVDMEQFAKDLRNPFFYRFHQGIKSLFSWIGSSLVKGLKGVFRSSMLWMVAGCGMIAMIGLQNRWVDAGLNLPIGTNSGASATVGIACGLLALVFFIRGAQQWVRELKD